MSTPTGPPDRRAGDLLDGRYRLVERLGRGGMGDVWRAEDVQQRRDVAVKTLRGDSSDPGALTRFRDEARHAGGLRHPGIAAVHDYGELDGAAWLVMELVEGEPLSQVLAREGALTVDRTLDLLAQAALALGAAHDAGVVHRDVKPGNLLLREDGVVKVTDFGIAASAAAAPHPPGTVAGTAYYLSPEQAAGQGTTTASDVYSLGVVAYECLAGRRPFSGDTADAVAGAHLRQDPEPLPVAVPAAVRALVARAMDKDPARRPADAGELARAARQVRRDLARPVHPPRRLHRRAVRLAATMLAVVALAAGVRSWAGGATHRTDVPALPAGTSVAGAEQAVRAAHLQPVSRPTPGGSAARGTVMATDPPSGTRVDEGSTVTLLVAGPA